MDKAYSILDGVVIGPTTASQPLANGEKRDKHEFLCADINCRRRKIRVSLVEADPRSNQPSHFRTCSRRHACLVNMGYPASSTPTAAQLHDGCEVYESSTRGEAIGNYERTFDGTNVTLVAGTPIKPGRPRGSTSGPPDFGPDSPPGPVREESPNMYLFGLVDAVGSWDEAALASGTIQFRNDLRTVSDVFMDASRLDFLSDWNPPKNHPVRRIRDDTVDYTQRKHVFFGSATARLLENGDIRIGFDGGIDIHEAYAQRPGPYCASQQISVFLKPALLMRSRERRLFAETLERLGIVKGRKQPCYAFVLGTLSASKSFLNVSPLDSTQNVVLLDASSAQRFETLRRFVADEELRRNAARLAKLKFDAQQAQDLIKRLVARAIATTADRSTNSYRPDPLPDQTGHLDFGAASVGSPKSSLGIVEWIKRLLKFDR